MLILLLMINFSFRNFLPVYTSMHEIFFSGLLEEDHFKTLLDIRDTLVKAGYMGKQKYCALWTSLVYLVHVQGSLPWGDIVLQTRKFKRAVLGLFWQLSFERLTDLQFYTLLLERPWFWGWNSAEKTKHRTCQCDKCLICFLTIEWILLIQCKICTVKDGIIWGNLFPRAYYVYTKSWNP